MKPHGDAVFGHEVRVFTAVQCQFRNVGVTGLDGLLIRLLLGCYRFVVDEVYAQVKVFAAFTVGQHVFYGGDQAFGLQIAAAQAEGTGIQLGNVVIVGVIRQVWEGRSVGAYAIFYAFAYRGPDFSNQRQIAGQRLVQALQYGNTFFAS